MSYCGWNSSFARELVVSDRLVDFTRERFREQPVSVEVFIAPEVVPRIFARTSAASMILSNGVVSERMRDRSSPSSGSFSRRRHGHWFGATFSSSRFLMSVLKPTAVFLVVSTSPLPPCYAEVAFLGVFP
jgi:hypothetical protein